MSNQVWHGSEQLGVQDGYSFRGIYMYEYGRQRLLD